MDNFIGALRAAINAIEMDRYDPGLPPGFAIARLFGKPIDAMFTPVEAP